MSERPLILAGADTLSGEAVLALLAETMSTSQILALGIAPEDDATASFVGENIPVRKLADHVFYSGDIVICVGDERVGEQTVSRAAQVGAVVIDATPFSRQQHLAPLVHPALNPEVLVQLPAEGILAVPGDIGMVVLPILRVCRQLGTLSRIDVHCHQSVSCYGSAGIQELATQTNRLLNGLPAQHNLFGEQIAFNLLAAVGTHAGDMASIEREIRELGEFEELPIILSSTIVPVFYGQVIQLSITFDWDIEVVDILDRFAELPDVAVMDDPEAFLSPVALGGLDEAERKWIHICAVEVCGTQNNVLRLIVVVDNIQVGAAGGAVKLYQQLTTGLF